MRSHYRILSLVATPNRFDAVFLLLVFHAMACSTSESGTPVVNLNEVATLPADAREAGLDSLAELVGEGDAMHETPKPENIPAGTIGQCVLVEVSEGNTACVMNIEQTFAAGVPELFQKDAPLGDLPSYIDLRGQLDGYHCPGVHDQGYCGWCTVHAVNAMLELEHCKNGPMERISEPHLWFSGGGDVGDCKGS